MAQEDRVDSKRLGGFREDPRKMKGQRSMKILKFLCFLFGIFLIISAIAVGSHYTGNPLAIVLVLAGIAVLLCGLYFWRVILPELSSPKSSITSDNALDDTLYDPMLQSTTSEEKSNELDSGGAGSPSIELHTGPEAASFSCGKRSNELASKKVTDVEIHKEPLQEESSESDKPVQEQQVASSLESTRKEAPAGVQERPVASCPESTEKEAPAGVQERSEASSLESTVKKSTC